MVEFKVTHKNITGVPWDSELEFTYFYAELLMDGVKKADSGIWHRTPDEAIRDAASTYANILVEEAPSGYARYGSRLRHAHGKAGSSNYTGYYLLEPQSEEVK